MASTLIQWTMMVWNCLRGCTEISPGCAHCYAAAIAARFSGPGQAYEGLAYFDANRKPHWTGKVRRVPSKLYEPLKWRKPQRIFVNSMSDLFHEDVPDSFIDQVFAVMGVAHWHTFQILTKRPERMAAYFAETWERPAQPARRVYDIDLPAEDAYIEDRWDRINKACDDIPMEVLRNHNWDHEDSLIGRPAWPRRPYDNVHLGVSVENQKTADERIPHLLRTPAAVRFLSVEPQLGPIDLAAIGEGDQRGLNSLTGEFRYYREDDGEPCSDWGPAISWVIQGGESGHNARPFDIAWARLLRDQCKASGTKYFCKQLGSHVIAANDEVADWFDSVGHLSMNPTERFQGAKGRVVGFRDSHGGDESEWPKDLQGCRAFPATVEVA